MKVDMLQVITRAADGMCLSGAYDRVFNRPDGSLVQVHVKNPQGWPWDGRIITDMVYDTFTEGKYGWNTAHQSPCGKDSIKLHTGHGGFGNPMFPRMVDIDALRKAPLVTDSADSPFQIWLASQTDLKPHSVNKTQFTLHAPRLQNPGEFANDIARRIKDSWVWHVDYHWGEKTTEPFPVLEQYDFITTQNLANLALFGLGRWTTSDWDGSKKAYVEKGRSDSNVLMTAAQWKAPNFQLVDCPLLEPMMQGVELL